MMTGCFKDFSCGFRIIFLYPVYYSLFHNSQSSDRGPEHIWHLHSMDRNMGVMEMVYWVGKRHNPGFGSGLYPAYISAFGQAQLATVRLDL